MPRTRVDLPQAFTFTTQIQVRITDVNYGGHVGNDSILSMIHEARIQYLQHNGLDELGSTGPGLIMRDVTIEFRKESFYGDLLYISVAANQFETASFDLVYKFERRKDSGSELVVAAKTGMVCYDYARKKVTPITADMRARLS